MLENVNLEIKDLEKKSAQLLRQNDPEQTYFRKHILKPEQFSTCKLFKMVEKSLTINIGGLY